MPCVADARASAKSLAERPELPLSSEQPSAVPSEAAAASAQTERRRRFVMPFASALAHEAEGGGGAGHDQARLDRRRLRHLDVERAQGHDPRQPRDRIEELRDLVIAALDLHGDRDLRVEVVDLLVLAL